MPILLTFSLCLPLLGPTSEASSKPSSEALGSSSVPAQRGRKPGGGSRGAKPGKKPGGKKGGKNGGKKGAAGKGKPGGQKRPAPPEDLPPTVPLDPGEPGWEAPPAVDVQVPSRPVHDDTTGRAGAEILAVAGSEAGLGAVWADARDGIPRLYMARYDLDGVPLEPERPVTGPGSDLEFLPSLALGPSGEGAVAWYSSRGGTEYVSLRTFDEEGEFLTGEQPIARRVPPEAEDEPALEPPCLVLDDEGRSFVLWRTGPVLTMAIADRSGRMTAPGTALSTPGQPALGPAFLTADSERVVAAWPGAQGAALWVQFDLGVTRRVELPEVGRPIGLEFDRPAPTEPANGLWLLGEDGLQRQLWHLDLSLTIDREPLLVDYGPERRAVLSTWVLGPVVLLDAAFVEPGDEARALELGYAYSRVEFYRADGHRTRAPLDFGEVRSSRESIHIASAVDRLWCAWNVPEIGSPRIAWWMLNPRRGQQPPPANLIEDSGNGHQEQVDVGSDEEATRALAVWSDGREPIPGIYARRVDPTEETPDRFPTRERRVDVPGHGGASWPAVAVDAGGRFLIVWKEWRDEGAVVVGRLFEASGRAATSPFDLDPGQTTIASSAPAVVALRSGRGFAVLWDRAGDGAWIRHLAKDGSFGAHSARLSQNDVIERPALCLLDDGGAVAAWDARVLRGLHAVRGTMLDFGLRAKGDLIRFEPMLHGLDWGPALAPGPRGGFLLAWTSGMEVESEVFCRFYDRAGVPAAAPFTVGTEAGRQSAPAVARLTDRSWIVAWQDDLSGVDRVVVRRIHVDGRRLGTPVSIEVTPEAPNPRASSPALAPVGNGWVGAWEDVRRSRGFDVYSMVFGSAFDAVPEVIFPEEFEDSDEVGQR